MNPARAAAHGGAQGPAAVVGIPARDEEGTIAGCLASVRAAATVAAVPAEIVVVDDASVDGTAALARAGGALVIHHDVPLGPAAAWRELLELGRAPVTFLVDADVTLHPEALRTGLEVLDAHPGVGLTSARAWPLAPGRGIVPRSTRFSAAVLHHLRSALDDHDVTTLGRCVAVRTAAWPAGSHLGPPCDRELGRTLRAAGWRLAYAPLMAVDYHPPATWTALRADYRRTHRAVGEHIPPKVSITSLWLAAKQSPLDGAAWLATRLGLAATVRPRAAVPVWA